MNTKTCFSMLAVFFVVATASGCKEEKPAQTVDWYKAHSEERSATIDQCNNNAGDKQVSANCINAKKAVNEQALEKRDTYKTRAPMDFKDK